MGRKSLLWQIFPPMVLVMIAMVIGGTFFSFRYLKDFYTTQTVADLTIRTRLVREEDA